MAGLTLANAEAQLARWLAADAAVATGQSYEIAGQRLTRANATEITQKIDYWNNKVVTLTSQSQGRSRSRTITMG